MPHHQNAGESTNEGYATIKSLETRDVKPFENDSCETKLHAYSWGSFEEIKAGKCLVHVWLASPTVSHTFPLCSLGHFLIVLVTRFSIFFLAM